MSDQVLEIGRRYRVVGLAGWSSFRGNGYGRLVMGLVGEYCGLIIGVRTFRFENPPPELVATNTWQINTKDGVTVMASLVEPVEDDSPEMLAWLEYDQEEDDQ